MRARLVMMLLLMCSSAFAQDAPGDSALDPTEPFRQQPTNMKDFIVGEQENIRLVGEAMQRANAYITETMKQKPMYCAPSKLTVVAEQYRQILVDYIGRNPDVAALPPDQLTNVVLLSLVDAFPCN